MKKALLALALVVATTGASLAVAENAVIGYYVAPGSTVNGNSCPSTAIQACFFPYGGTIPIGGGSSSSPSFVKLAPLTIVPLDISSVTTGGTAVIALSAGHKTAGGFLQNPPSATTNLCINEQGTASGTTSAGATTCIIPGQTYALTPSSGAVSVISSDSNHPFSGYGLN